MLLVPVPPADAVKRRRWACLVVWKDSPLSVVDFVTMDPHNTNMTVIGLPPLPSTSYLSMVMHLACLTCRNLISAMF